MQIGIDILELKEFKKSWEQTPSIKTKVFHDDEIRELSELSIAGKFCAKEAAIKAGLIKVGDWLMIKVLNKESGEPVLIDALTNTPLTASLSISHTNSIIVAVAVRI